VFRAGDTVRHELSGQEWVLAADERGGYVMPCGWPEGQAKASDCTLVEAASDEERLKMLHDVKGIRRDNGSLDERARWAQEQLAQEESR
jgi:hypothetical protein